MKADLAALQIHPSELERLAGLEINDLFIGGLIGGTVRSSLLHYPQRLLAFGLTELAIIILVMVATSPIGLLMIRGVTGAVQDAATITPVLRVILGITIVIVLLWNGLWLLKARQMAVLAALVDDVDRYNEVIHAVDVLDRLAAAGHYHIQLDNRADVLKALELVRESLICGVMTDRILRENRGLLSRRYDLFTSIETNLSTLKAIEVSHQANDYSRLLNQALQIGTNVYREIQAVSPPPETC